MRRVALRIVCSAMLALCGGAGTASASAINPILSGAGGTGTASISGDDASDLSVTKDFTNVDFIDVTFTVDTGDSYRVFDSIVNHTGQAWSGFRFEIVSAPSSQFYFISAFQSSLTELFTTVLPDVSTQPHSVTFSGGSVPAGGSWDAAVGFNIFSPGEVIVRQTPLSAEAPEPATLVLGGVAALFGAGRQWARRRSRIRA